MKPIVKSFVKDLLRAIGLLWNTDKKLTIINTALQVVQALLPVVLLYYMKAMLDAITAGTGDFNNLLSIIIVFGLLHFVSALVNQYNSYISILYQQKLTDKLSSDVLSKAVKVDYDYYENPAYHDTLHLAQQQSVFKVSQLFNNFNAIILNSFSLIFMIGYFFSLQSLFALCFLLVSVPLAVVKWYSGYALLKQDQKFAPLERDANYLYQTLTGINSAKEVRIFGFGNLFIEKFRKIRLYIQNERRKLNVKFNSYSLLAEAAEIIVMVVILGLLAKQAFDKVITIATLVVYIQGFQKLQSTARGFLQSLVQLFQLRLFLRHIFLFFDIENRTSEKGISFPNHEKGLSVKNISFSYPESTKLVLDNVSINCAPGEIIAIVGENGSGKSTLVKLLARLYSLQSGSISINGAFIDEIDMDDFRKNTTTLFQDFEKYFLTIKENIALGEDIDQYNPVKLEEAAKLSGADQFISGLSKGYDSRMGKLFKGCEQLSGGQWQKLALARVFYKDTKLLVLDEPTSFLDAYAEMEVFNNLKKQFKNQMVVLITHRLYNLKMADYIYMMHEGVIVEQGTFEEMLQNNGKFKKMYDAQKL